MNTKSCLIAYGIVAVATFGASWHHNPYTKDSVFSSKDEMNCMSSIGCAALWPLYWSYRLFEPRHRAERQPALSEASGSPKRVLDGSQAQETAYPAAWVDETGGLRIDL